MDDEEYWQRQERRFSQTSDRYWSLRGQGEHWHAFVLASHEWFHWYNVRAMCNIQHDAHEEMADRRTKLWLRRSQNTLKIMNDAPDRYEWWKGWPLRKKVS